MHIRHIRGSLPALLLAPALILSVMFVVRTRATSDAKNEKRSTLGSSATEAVASQAVTQNIYKQHIRVWVHNDGIRPRISHAKPGTVRLTVANETALQAELVVERVLPNQASETIGSVRLRAQRKRATRELLLTVGEYVIYERSRPELKGTLMVD